MRSSWFQFYAAGGAAVLLASCAHAPSTPERAALRVPCLVGRVAVDGRLGEACYRQFAPVTDFKVASHPDAVAPETKAWLFRNETEFWFAFAVRDDAIVAAPPSRDEHAVDTQDRVELFLWPEDLGRTAPAATRLPPPRDLRAHHTAPPRG